MWQYLLFYGEFTGILVFLGLIWWESVRRSQTIHQALVEVAIKSAETSNKSSEAALKAAEAALKASEAARQAVEAFQMIAASKGESAL